ncbi:peptide chain release factor N(5)-glutamine methyltransferase [Zhouia amylolytica]|uniref:Release factor glutamine methyltransferase n=1 Tax=Zhouia amylolytica AD3 TaxID=1286632 RepID=W2UNX8_9FLAO|nr:peptide chain release factor N(5)-glutamine methyltransferase [Zhouia amylolytica]ETN95654.1 N5-glutamine S-adenosyl-L-methionine-dependent methyltransferase [Zhouia amylolytica AD3]
MRLNDIQDIFHKELDDLYDFKEVNRFYYLLLDHNFDIQRIDIILEPDKVISKKEETIIFKALDDLKLQKPIQQILGVAYFYGLKFRVNNETLIPRPETEELVDWIIRDCKDKIKPLKILDIGTGSGCIAITLSKNIPLVEVTAIDISGKALDIAKENALNNHVDINFLQADILKLESLLGEYDIIVSNPPYVRYLEKEQMKSNVVDFEPHAALFVPDQDPLLFYKQIARLSSNHLNQEGNLYFEINQYLAKDTTDMLDEFGFKNTIVKKDLSGNDRMIRTSFA